MAGVVFLGYLGEMDSVDKQMDLLQGTLDMLILKAVSLGPLHGYGVLLRIQQIGFKKPFYARKYSKQLNQETQGSRS